MAATHSKLWLLLDIGNTQTVAGILDPAQPQEVSRIRFRTDAQATADEYRATLAQLFAGRGVGLWDSLERIIVSTVVPALDSVIRESARGIPTLSIAADTRRDFELDLPYPGQLGADRLANVAGALTLAKPPFLIVDAGTATTFCLIDSRPAYIGGAIVPGLEISWKALQTRAAKLFSVELIRPESSVGRTTESQIQSGMIYGYESLIEGMTDRLLEDAKRSGRELKSPTLFATGGCINWLKLSSRFRIEPNLTLLGLLEYGRKTQ